MVGNIPFFFCLVSLSFIKFVTIPEEEEEEEEEELCKSQNGLKIELNQAQHESDIRPKF